MLRMHLLAGGSAMWLLCFMLAIYHATFETNHGVSKLYTYVVMSWTHNI